MPSEKPLSPRKEPRQRRARETVRAIVEAAARILATDGPSALDTNRIAEVAGVSVGSLYQYFPNKESIVARLVELLLDEDEAFVQDCLVRHAGEPVDTRLRALARAVVERQRAQLPLMQQLLPLVPEVERSQLVHETLERLTAAVLPILVGSGRLAPELRDDPVHLQIALFCITRSVHGVLNAVTLERPEWLDDPRFPKELARPVLALLETRGDPGDPDPE
jgi:AcrR family transcriptional regulator